ncbi:MAG: DUF2589 domain-containing protein [Fimbriimonadaceae bacterium]|nr:DUF2589 domain-containing protein [Fimbriimonadaceae bacterium]
MADGQDPTILELGELFAMPLNALIDADARAASCFADFVQTHGFEPDPDNPNNGLGRLKMVAFTYEQQLPDGRVEPVRLKIPLLSLLTLPALGIQDATVKFGVNIIKPVQSAVAKTQNLSTSALPAPQPIPRMLARVAAPQPTGQERPSTRAHMEVTVNIKQLDFPDGILQLLNRMANSTIVRPTQPNMPTLTLNPETTNLIGKGSFTIVKATLLDTSQNPIPGQKLNLMQGPDNVFSLQSTEIITDRNGEASFSVVVVNAPPTGTTSETIVVVALVADQLGHLSEIRANLTFTVQA